MKIIYPACDEDDVIGYPKAYKMNQAGVGIFGVMGILLFWQKIDTIDAIIIAGAFVYALLMGVAFITLLAIKNKTPKLIKFSKVSNYFLIAIIFIANTLAIAFGTVILLHGVVSFSVFCIPAVINIRCLNDIRKQGVVI
jgi:hypothetical protein